MLSSQADNTVQSVTGGSWFNSFIDSALLYNSVMAILGVYRTGESSTTGN